MLVAGKKFRVSWASSGGISGYGHSGVYIDLHRRQAELVVAGLIAQLQGDVQSTCGSVGLRSEGNADNHLVLVDIQRGFGERKRVQFAFRIDGLSRLKASGELWRDACRDKVARGSLMRIDMEAAADFQYNRQLKICGTSRRLERGINCSRDNILSLRYLRLSSRKSNKHE